MVTTGAMPVSFLSCAREKAGRDRLVLAPVHASPRSPRGPMRCVPVGVLSRAPDSKRTRELAYEQAGNSQQAHGLGIILHLAGSTGGRSALSAACRSLTVARRSGSRVRLAVGRNQSLDRDVGVELR